MQYRRRVINKQRAKVPGICAIFRTRVIRQNVSLKIIGFCMETPFWSPSEGLQHGVRKPVETSGVYFGSLKTFILSVKLENIRMGTFSTYWLLKTRKHKAKRYFRRPNMLCTSQFQNRPSSPGKFPGI